MKNSSLILLSFILLFGACRDDIIVDENITVIDEIDLESYNSYVRIIEDDMTTQIFVDCTARKTKDETLVTAIDTSTGTIVILGIKGFQKGSFLGNIYGLQGPAHQGLKNASSLDIELYQEVGGKVTGKFIDGTKQGEFVAERI